MLISDKEFKKLKDLNRLVVDEIKKEQQSLKQRYKKDKAKDPNWDKDF